MHCDTRVSVVLLSLVVAAACVVAASSAARDQLSEAAGAHSATVTIQSVAKPLWPASQQLWGIMYEEGANQGAGGLHTELLQNGLFQNSSLDGWRLQQHSDEPAPACSMRLDSTLPHINEILPNAMLMKAAPASRLCAAVNAGFPTHIGVRAGLAYNVSLWARTTPKLAASDAAVTVVAELWDESNATLGQLVVTGISEVWTQFSGQIHTTLTQDAWRAQFAVVVPPGLTVWIHGVSLIPDTHWRGLPFIRPDLGDMMAALHPAFLRFPGGNFLEGADMARAYRWKEAIGPYIERTGVYDMWGYWSPNLLGPFELLQFSEALGATPIWVVNCGMAFADYVDEEHIYEFVQEAVDAVEFALGDQTTYWGSKRAQMGHAKPFDENNFMIAIGNEEDFGNLNKGGLPVYAKYYPLFYHAIKRRYPNVMVIANNATVVVGGKKARDQIAEYHDYNPAAHFIEEREMWAKFRPSAYMFVSEFGAWCEQQGPYCPSPWAAAVAEAAFMIGMERYSNMVVMACSETIAMYAMFNELQTYGEPQYWTKQIFAEQLGTHVLPTSAVSTSHAEENITITAVALTRTSAETGGLELVLKMANWGAHEVEVTVETDDLPAGWQLSKAASVWTVLNGTDANSTNSFEHPQEVYPTRLLSFPLTPVVPGSSFRVTLPYSSIHVAVIPLCKTRSAGCSQENCCSY